MRGCGIGFYAARTNHCSEHIQWTVGSNDNADSKSKLSAGLRSPDGRTLEFRLASFPSWERVHLKSRRLATTLILLVPIALVATPVLWSGMRSEVAHWYLAAAANAVELGIGDAESAIESARRWDPDVEKLSDYWTVRIRQLAKLPRKSGDKSDGESPALHFQNVPRELAVEVSSKIAQDLARVGKFKEAASAMREVLGNDAMKTIFYWDLVVSDAFLENGASQALELIREAVAMNPENDKMRTSLTAQYASIFMQNSEFDAALDAYKMLYGEKYPRDRETLNTMAYARALALRELDEALVDIDEALTYAPQDASLRDTRAWVLYQLGRYEDALVDADFAVKEFEKPTFTNWLQSQLAQQQMSAATQSLKDKRANEPKSESESRDEAEAGSKDSTTAELFGFGSSFGSSEDVYLSPAFVDPMVWTRGVIHYHRAKILEKLGRSEQAQVDWDYLEKHRLPPDDRLH